MCTANSVCLLASRSLPAHCHFIYCTEGISPKLCCLQYSNFIGTSIGYTITAGLSMAATKNTICYHNNPGQLAEAQGPDGATICTVSTAPALCVIAAGGHGPPSILSAHSRVLLHCCCLGCLPEVMGSSRASQALPAESLPLPQPMLSVEGGGAISPLSLPCCRPTTTSISSSLGPSRSFFLNCQTWTACEFLVLHYHERYLPCSSKAAPVHLGLHCCTWQREGTTCQPVWRAGNPGLWC